MREYEFVIDEALLAGLTPFDINKFNLPVLNEALGFRVGKGQLELYGEKADPLSPALDWYYDWPFPQYMASDYWNILVIRDTVNQEDDVYYVSDDHATVIPIFSVDELTFGKGGLMEIADFGEYLLMGNGVCMIHWDPALVAWVAFRDSTTIPVMGTICSFKGQAVGGNVTGVWNGAAFVAWHDCDETFYIWSKIGEMDFTPDNKNTAGYRRCPFGGEVLNVRRLINKVVGYSTKGITLLTPVTDPSVTFGFSELSDVGLINKGAVGCGPRRHIYVGEDYRLREITDEGIKELGYQQYMERLVEDIVITYDPINKDFYIGDSFTTFLLSPQGLSEVPQHPSAVWKKDKVTYMIPDTVDDYEALITSEAFDLEYRGNKTIFSVESDILVVDNPQVAIDYYLSLTAYGTSDYKPVNNEGICAIIASGSAFRVNLKFDPTYDNTRIGYIKVRYKMTDLRGLRGVYAPPPRGQ